MVVLVSTKFTGWYREVDNTAYELDDVGAQPEQFAVFKEARSIHKAIMILKDVTGLQASDMHDRNVMVRPETGDIVIVDLGLFRKCNFNIDKTPISCYIINTQQKNFII